NSIFMHQCLVHQYIMIVMQIHNNYICASSTDDQPATPQKKKTKVESRASSIVSAKDLTHEEYEEISHRKKIGKTSTDENLQCDKHYWQNFFLTNTLDESVLNNFLYGTNPLQNYVGLIDAKEPRQGGQPQVRESAI
ncbi:MAG: hypothetical protein ACKPKO_41345, partial [Candidatus Fonsibacter sp.]